MLNILASLDESKRVDAELKMCYRNALVAFLTGKYYANDAYVEGYILRASLPFLPIEHGWIQAGGEIIDPTIILTLEDEEEVWYYPAVEFTKEEALKLLNKTLPFVTWASGNGLGYKLARAHYACWEKMVALGVFDKIPEVFTTFLREMEE